MNLLLFTKDVYPFQRVHLNQLFMTYFASKDDRLFWVAYGEGAEQKKEGYNQIFLIKSSFNKGKLGYIISRLSTYKKYLLGKKIIQNNKIDIILSSDGVIEGIIGYILSRILKKKFAYYLTSLFYDIEKNDFKNSPSILSFLKMVKGFFIQPFYFWIIKKSDFFHPISDSMGRFFIDKGIPEEKIHSLPLCPSNIMLMKTSEKLIKNNNIFLMIYVGQITPGRKIDFLVDIAYELKKKIKIQFKIKIVGKIFRKSYNKLLLKKIKDLSLTEEVELINEVPFEKVPALIEECDLGLSILPPIIAYRVSSPTKVLEYLSRNIPVVGNSEIEDQRIIIKKSGGGFTPSYSKKMIVNVIYDMMSGKYNLKEMGKQGRDWVIKYRTYNNVVSELKKFYSDKLSL